jgi:hypothetical protein
LKILDRNGDGRVSLQDLEDLCNKYLTSRWLTLYIHLYFESIFKWMLGLLFFIYFECWNKINKIKW